MFEHREDQDRQEEFWVERKSLPRATPNAFYRKLDRALKEMGFAESVREICRPAYAEAEKGGRPGIDPAVYLMAPGGAHPLGSPLCCLSR